MIKPTPSGALLIDKQAGITSFSSLSVVKKLLGTKKVGHTGTLDSFASGLLVVLFGNMTKLASIIEAQKKSYSGVVSMGIETDTLDPTGVIVLEKDIPSYDELQKASAKFLGTISQTPPLYSAIKINGKRASDLVRAKKEVVLKSREIEIFSFSLFDYNSEKKELSFYVECSKGTYIRTLLQQLFYSVESCCHLKSLCRESVGNFLVDDAQILKDDSIHLNCIDELTLVSLVDSIALISIDKITYEKLRYGKPITNKELSHFDFDSEKKYLALSYKNSLVAVLEKAQSKYSYRYNGAS